MTLLARTDLDQKARSLGFSADGSHLAVGLGDGSFMVLKARYTTMYSKQGLQLSMLDFPLMLWVKLPVVDRIQLQSNQFVTGVENKATGVLKLQGSKFIFGFGSTCATSCKFLGALPKF